MLDVLVPVIERLAELRPVLQVFVGDQVLETRRVQQRARLLASQLPALVEQLRPLVLRLSESVAFVDGIDPAVQDLGKVLGYQVFGGSNPRPFLIEHLDGVKRKFRDE